MSAPNSQNNTLVESLEPRWLFSAAPVASYGTTSTDGTTLVDVTTSTETSFAFESEFETLGARFGLLGKGQTVAIVDSGIAYDHYALGSGLGTGSRVVGGWDFAENDADPYDDGPMGFHGTHVAGIIASDDAQHPGLAPQVDLVALRVFDDAGHSENKWVVSALEWIHEHRFDFEHPITTVNLSLSVEALEPETADALESALQTLVDDGLFISVAAGNNYDGTQALNDPASSAFVVPVGSVGADGALSDFSQRDERILAAPGEMVTSTVPDYLYGFDGVTDDFLAASGTSMAAPHVAAASVLLRQLRQQLGQGDQTQSNLYNHLVQTADRIPSASGSREYHRLNLERAIMSALGPDESDQIEASALVTQLTLDGIVHNTLDQDTYRVVTGATGIVSVDLDWTADSTPPELRIEGATHLGASEYLVQAGTTLELALSNAESVGAYEIALTLVADQPVALPPTPSAHSEAAYEWTPGQGGWYELNLEFAASQPESRVRIYDGSDKLTYASSQMFTDHTVRVYVTPDAPLRIKMSGRTSESKVSATYLGETESANAGGQQATSLTGDYQGLAAVVFTAPDQVHQLAWSSDEAFSLADLSLAVDDSEHSNDIPLPPLEPPWLVTIANNLSRSTRSNQLTDEEGASRVMDMIMSDDDLDGSHANQ